MTDTSTQAKIFMFTQVRRPIVLQTTDRWLTCKVTFVRKRASYRMMQAHANAGFEAGANLGQHFNITANWHQSSENTLSYQRPRRSCCAASRPAESLYHCSGISSHQPTVWPCKRKGDTECNQLGLPGCFARPNLTKANEIDTLCMTQAKQGLNPACLCITHMAVL